LLGQALGRTFVHLAHRGPRQRKVDVLVFTGCLAQRDDRSRLEPQRGWLRP
jgi:hypothetical protein